MRRTGTVRDQQMNKRSGQIRTVLWVTVLGISASLLLNGLSTHLNLPAMDMAYREAAEQLYSVSLPVGILMYVFLSPLAEEILFRFGATWVFEKLIKRLTRRAQKLHEEHADSSMQQKIYEEHADCSMQQELHEEHAAGSRQIDRNGQSTVWIVFLTALLFGIYHGNFVQGSYAFLMGILLELLYLVQAKKLFYPVLLHAVSNLCIYSMSYQTDLYALLIRIPMLIVWGMVMSVAIYQTLHEKRKDV